MTKAQSEVVFVENLINDEVTGYTEMCGEGRAINNIYYRFSTTNGGSHYWTNMSEENLQRIKEYIKQQEKK